MVSFIIGEREKFVEKYINLFIEILVDIFIKLIVEDVNNYFLFYRYINMKIFMLLNLMILVFLCLNY